MGLGLLLSAGCVSPDIRSARALENLRGGDASAALAWSTDLKSSLFSRQLGCLENGRVRMLTGDFARSSASFASVIESIIVETDSGPSLRLGSIGALVMAGTLADDRLREYEVPPYEFIQSLQYQMLNHLFLGNLEAAGVEARRAVFAQDAVAETYGRAVVRARNAAAGSQSGAVADRVAARMRPLAQATGAGGPARSYENSLAWYLCGVLFEQQDDLANAALSFRKAWELAPANPYLRKDCLRLLRTQDEARFRSLAAQTGADVDRLARDGTEVILLFEEALVSQRQSVKVTLPVGGTLVSVVFPAYLDAAYTPMPLEVRSGADFCGTSEPAVSIQSLACSDLREKLPGMALRNVTRAATHVTAQRAANRGQDAVRYGVLAANIFAAAINQADLRAWRTLPMTAQVFRGGLAPGEHQLELRNRSTGRSMRFPVRLAPGETRLVWVADTGGLARVATASLNGKGGPATFEVCNSLLTDAPGAMTAGMRKGYMR